jgi:uncharacterized protein
MNFKTLEEIKAKMAAMQFDEAFDAIVAIANGGILPATLLAEVLGLKVECIKINYRDACHTPVREKPELLETFTTDIAGKKILLVDDRVKTGATLNYARQLLTEKGAIVKTLALNGPADYPLYNEACFKVLTTETQL